MAFLKDKLRIFCIFCPELHAFMIRYKSTSQMSKETIRENMYMPYFPGLEEFAYAYVFARSLFNTLRYRLGTGKFDVMTCQIILTSEGKHEVARKNLDENQSENQIQEESTEKGKSKRIEKPKGSSKGTLIVDATTADQMIAYPTDLCLLAKIREERELLMDYVTCLILIKKFEL